MPRFTGQGTKTGGEEYDVEGTTLSPLRDRFRAAPEKTRVEPGATPNPFDAAIQSVVEGVTGTTSKISKLKKQIKAKQDINKALRRGR